MLYSVGADIVVAVHFAFILLVILGGVVVIRRPRFAWLHVPAVLWAALVELAGWICPLTPLEKLLREKAGGVGYESGFIEHYIMPVIYPSRLTRPVQICLGLSVLVLNGILYGWVCYRRRSRARAVT